MSTDALAFTLNMTSGKNEVIQVQTDTNQFFNVIFQEEEWKPNAEQVYTMYMGQNYNMWRYSGDQNTSKPGTQPWKTAWGILSDFEMAMLMEGNNPSAIVTLNEQLPQGVKDFIGRGGSWEDIKVTFQCENSDGMPLEPKKLFVNGAVDCLIKWGTEVQLAFKPYFRGAEQMISDATSMQVKRGMYPYSNTMFSIFTKTSNPKHAKHLGAAMVYDTENNEDKYAPNKYEGYTPLLFSDVLNTKGDLAPNKALKNIEPIPGACRCGSHPNVIDTNKARIGNGSTFNSGGAIGISFHFPVKITFEINPMPTANQVYLSEYSIVNMADDADPDNLTTSASLQAYSNRDQLIQFFGNNDLYEEVMRLLVESIYPEYANDDSIIDGLVNSYNADIVYTLLDKARAGELDSIIRQAKEDLAQKRDDANTVQSASNSWVAEESQSKSMAEAFGSEAVSNIELLQSNSSSATSTLLGSKLVNNTSNALYDAASATVDTYKEVKPFMSGFSKQLDITATAHNIKLNNTYKNNNSSAMLDGAVKSRNKERILNAFGIELSSTILPDIGPNAVPMYTAQKLDFSLAFENAVLYQSSIYSEGDKESFKRTRDDKYLSWHFLTRDGSIPILGTDKGALTLNHLRTGESLGNKEIKIEYAKLYAESLRIYARDHISDKIANTSQYEAFVNFLSNHLVGAIASDTINVYDLAEINISLANFVGDGDAKKLFGSILNYTDIIGRGIMFGAPSLQVISGSRAFSDMNNKEKLATKSSAVGKYIMEDNTGVISSSMSLIETGNLNGMMGTLDKSRCNTVILLPTITQLVDKEIGQDAFRKLAYARAEKLYSLIRNDKIFDKCRLKDEYKDRLITDNEDDLRVLSLNKYFKEMSFNGLKDEKFYHTGYTTSTLSDTIFARTFGNDENVEHEEKTLGDLNIVGDNYNGVTDSYYMTYDSIPRIDAKFSNESTSVWGVRAYKFSNSTQVNAFLEDAIWRSGECSVGISDVKENKKIDDSLNYNGGIAYTDVILDKGCDIVLSAFSIDNNGNVKEIRDTRQGINFPYTLPIAATRYSPTAPFKDDYYKGLENPLLTDNTSGAYNMIANIPEGMSNTTFYENAKKLVEESIAEGKATDGAVLEGYGIRVHVGKDAVKNTLVYPTQSQIDNDKPIRLAMFYAEIENPEIVKVYELTDGSTTVHVKTTTTPAVVADDTVVVEDETMDGTEYKVGEAYVSTDLYEVTDTTPWSEIDNHTDVYDSEVIYNAGELTLDPEKQQRVYVRMVGKLPTSITAPTGNFNITQQTVGKKFDTSGLGISAQDCLSSFNSTRHKYYTSKGRVRRCSIYTTSDDTYSLDYNMTTNGDSKIFSNITPLESGDRTGSKTWNRSRTVNTTLNPKYTFVAWRGYDKPVAASYANESWVLNDVYAKYGIGSAKERGNSELNSSYTKTATFDWRIGSGSDTSVKFSCSHGYTHSGTVGQYGEHSGMGNVSVQVYEGWKGAQTPANSSPASTSMGGASLTSAHKGTVNGGLIAYHPYVMMKYQDISGNTNSVNVLSKYKSNITPINTIEFGVQKGSNTSLGITSSMWSTHKRATNAKGANNVIAGGATYNLGNNGAQLPTIGVTTYQWYVPNDAAGAVVSGASNTQAKAEQSHNEAVSSLKTTLTGNKVLQHLKAGSNNFVVAPGMSTPWLGSGLNLTNSTNAESKKYWFGGMVNPKTKVISDGGTTREYFRISSDTSGNVILTKGSHTDHTFNINHDTDYILNNMNAEWKEINAKTGLVSAYLGSIIRRAGNDTSYGAAGGMWYNEAFPGLCVAKQTSTFVIGMDTGSNASLQNVVDMRLVAGGTNSKADIYKNFNDSWFAVEGKNVNFNFRGKALTLNTGELNLRSKTFYIPNATVYDND